MCVSLPLGSTLCETVAELRKKVPAIRIVSVCNPDYRLDLTASNALEKASDRFFKWIDTVIRHDAVDFIKSNVAEFFNHGRHPEGFGEILELG